MFGLLSLPKLILTAAIVMGVWYGFKWLNQRQAQVTRAAKNKRHKPKQAAYSQPDEPDIEEMMPYPNCGAYVAKGSNHRCG